MYHGYYTYKNEITFYKVPFVINTIFYLCLRCCVPIA